MSQRSERFVALLRGINVGGNNIIPKDALRRCFEELGFTQVRTRYVPAQQTEPPLTAFHQHRQMGDHRPETPLLISTPNPCCSTKSRLAPVGADIGLAECLGGVHWRLAIGGFSLGRRHHLIYGLLVDAGEQRPKLADR